MHYYYLLYIKGNWRIEFLNYCPLVMPPADSPLSCTEATQANCPEGLVIWPIWQGKEDMIFRIGGQPAGLYEVTEKVIAALKAQGKLIKDA